jgi:inner membrane protein
MHREGHIGAALLAYAPLGALVLALGFPAAAIGGGLTAAGLAMVPDFDHQIPFLAHRGVTHTVPFAVLVAVLTGAAAGFGAHLHPKTGLLWMASVAGFGAAVGGLTMLSHIGADALTPMGVRPFGDGGRHISYEVCRADSTLGNYALLILGVAAVLVALGVGKELATLLPV